MKAGQITAGLRRACATVEAAYMAQQPAMTLPQLMVMVALEDGPQTQVDLIDMTGIDRSTLSAMLQKMKEASLVTVTRMEADTRATEVLPTRGGRASMKTALRAMEVAEKTLLEKFPAGTSGEVRRVTDAMLMMQARPPRSKKARKNRYSPRRAR